MTLAVLERAKATIEPALRSAVDSLDANLWTPAAYHLGWVDADGTETDADSGKGMRPALAILGAEAAGGTATDAVPGAIAVELIHNFSLIHDDIMDNDRMRRHRRTVWDVFGVGDAIIVGDALHVLAFQVLFADDAGGSSGPRQSAAASRLAKATSAMIAGQAQDVALDRAERATIDDCVRMEANKTGALLAQAAAIGAVLGGGDGGLVTAMESYGLALGVAFQAVDDVLGVWGDPSRTGKAVGNDLREKKKSMPIALALDRGDDVARAVLDAFSGSLGDEEVAELTALLDAAGIRAEVEAIADRYLNDALAALDKVALSAQVKGELVDLAHFTTTRRA